MAEKPTPYERLMHMQTYNTKLAHDQKCHMIRRACTDSNWPFTGNLSPQEIACMVDSYFGKRRTASCMPDRCGYDRLYHKMDGWNQCAIKDTRENFKECQYSANQEDTHRTVVICDNATYGHYLDRFIDFTFKDHGHEHTCKSFYSHGRISALPPIRDINGTHTHGS